MTEHDPPFSFLETRAPFGKHVLHRSTEIRIMADQVTRRHLDYVSAGSIKKLRLCNSYLNSEEALRHLRIDSDDFNPLIAIASVCS